MPPTEPGPIEEVKVARFLRKIRRLRDPQCMAKLVAEITSRQDGFSVAVEATPESIAAELSEDEVDGWEALLDAVVSNPDLFHPKKRAVSELTEYLVSGTKDLRVNPNVILELHTFVLVHGLPPAWLDAYYRTVEELDLAPPTTEPDLDHAVGFLLSVRTGGTIALCKFLERLGKQMDDVAAKELQNCLGTIAGMVGVEDSRLRRIHDEVQHERDDVRTHVLARISTTPDGGKRLAVWKYYCSRTPGAVTAPLAESRVLGLDDRLFNDDDEVRAELYRLLTLPELLRMASDRQPRRPVLELMLPRDRIDEPVEDWPVSLPGTEPVTLGTLLPVVVRPHPEPRDPHRRVRCRRWNEIHNGDGHRGRVYNLHGNGAIPPVTGDWLCLAMSGAVDRHDTVTKARRAGIPIAIWSRDGTDVRDVLEGPGLHELPDAVFLRRRNGHSTARLAVMWDDPYWIPDESDLRWRSA